MQAERGADGSAQKGSVPLSPPTFPERCLLSTLPGSPVLGSLVPGSLVKEGSIVLYL